MKIVLLVVAALLLATSAHANLVTNGTFSAGLDGWAVGGGTSLLSGNPFGMPTSPSGDPSAGVVSAWGGDWGAPWGSLTQTVNMLGAGTLSGELFAGSHAGDMWRNAGVEVLWNGGVVAALWRDGDPTKWGPDWPWASFFNVPVVGTGANQLKVQYTVHFAEWTWTAADNLQVNLIPEPGSLLALGVGLVGLVSMLRRFPGHPKPAPK